MMNNLGFAVRFPSRNNDSKGVFKKSLLNFIEREYPYLSLAGLDAPEYDALGRRIKSIEYVGPKDTMTFGLSDYHDVAYATKPSDLLNEQGTGFAPVYDIADDWNTVINKLTRFAEAKEREESCYNCPLRNVCGKVKKPKYNEADAYYLSDGTKVTIFDNFIKIGNTIVPRNITPVFIAKAPVATRELIKRTIVTITRLA